MGLVVLGVLTKVLAVRVVPDAPAKLWPQPEPELWKEEPANEEEPRLLHSAANLMVFQGGIGMEMKMETYVL